jgi:4-hydroxyacetophenone monooxygenase
VSTLTPPVLEQQQSNSVEPAMASKLNFDEERAWRAVRLADANVLRMALYQLTGDPQLAAMRVETVPVRNGAMTAYALAEAHHRIVQEKAVAFLRNPQSAPAWSNDSVREMMTLFSGVPLTDDQFRLGLEELALVEFPREVKWSNGEKAPRGVGNITVAIVGAGISGLAVAFALRRLGIPFVIIERQGDVGGTWQLNTYPDARVDTSSYLYQYKFEKRYPWPEFYASQASMLGYLRHIADKYEIRPHILFSTKLKEAAWSESDSRWRLGLEDPRGQRREIKANFLVSASGLFSVPNFPDIPGIEGFQNKMLHTASWDHSYNFTGKKIALIGNGSSGAQIMPRLAAKATSLTVYQRTPSWIVEMKGYKSPVPDDLKWLHQTMPFYWNWLSYSSYVTTLGLQPAQTLDAEWRKRGGLVSEKNDALRAALESYIRLKLAGKPDLIEKSIPRYAPLARRLVIDNGWYDALLRSNVELVTSAITRISPRGVVTAEGLEREFDLIVLGAGFKTSRYLWPVRYVGKDGATLENLWAADGARANLGMTMPGFPNFFMMYGPNSQPRTGSFMSWAEIWARYCVRLIVAMIETGASSIECKPEAFERFNREMDDEGRKIIWEAEGGSGYYVNEYGRSGVNMPWLVEEYHRRVSQPDLDEFILSK